MGRVALEADGLAVQDARLPGRQGRLLFAYLAVERGTAGAAGRARGGPVGGGSAGDLG